MRGLSRPQDAASAVISGPGHAATGEPGAKLLVQCRRRQLARQDVTGQPVLKLGLGCLVARDEGEVIQGGQAMPGPLRLAQV